MMTTDEIQEIKIEINRELQKERSWLVALLKSKIERIVLSLVEKMLKKVLIRLLGDEANRL